MENTPRKHDPLPGRPKHVAGWILPMKGGDGRPWSETAKRGVRPILPASFPTQGLRRQGVDDSVAIHGWMSLEL